MSVASQEPSTAHITKSRPLFEGANIHLALLWSVVALLSACLIAANVHTWTVIATGAALLYSLGAAFENLVGVKAHGDYISAPMPISPRWPMFTLGRARIPLSEVDRLGPGISVFGQQTLLVDTKHGQFPVSFGNADQAIAFLELVRRERPGAEIKRYLGVL